VVVLLVEVEVLVLVDVEEEVEELVLVDVEDDVEELELVDVLVLDEVLLEVEELELVDDVVLELLEVVELELVDVVVVVGRPAVSWRSLMARATTRPNIDTPHARRASEAGAQRRAFTRALLPMRTDPATKKSTSPPNAPPLFATLAVPNRRLRDT
jgi:hypothetical protein